MLDCADQRRDLAGSVNGADRLYTDLSGYFPAPALGKLAKEGDKLVSRRGVYRTLCLIQDGGRELMAPKCNTQMRQ